MSYTLNQLEVYANSNFRLWNFIWETRKIFQVPKGQEFGFDEALRAVEELQRIGNADSDYIVSCCLDGATIDELKLYARIEQQRATIRHFEFLERKGATSRAQVLVARADFKSFLKDVPL